MPGIMEKMFGVRPTQQQQTQMPTPGNMPQGSGTAQPGTAGTAPNGTTPTVNTENPATSTESPFAKFEKLWETPTSADGKPIATTTEPLFTVDPKTVMEAAQRTDFKSVATAEQLARVAAGGQEGVAAMMDIMQAMSASVYANAAVAATKIAESGISRALAQAETRLPNAVRNLQLSESLALKNPALRNPAVAPIVEMMKSQFAQKYPTASVSELQAMAEDYMLKVGGAFNPAATQAEADNLAKQDAAGSEWDRFFDTPSGGALF